MTKYRTIVADPPWPMPSGGPRGGQASPWDNLKNRPSFLPYPTLEVGEIQDLPIRELSDEDGAHLYMWVVNRHIEAAYDIARCWGFRPVQLLTWAKTPKGVGLGGAFVQTTEHVLFARRGTLAAMSRRDSCWWNWPRTDSHSRKPDAFMDMVEQVSPGPYLEMFARRQRLGWDTWGNEALNHVEITT